MKKFIITDILSNSFMQNINIDSEKQSDSELDNGAQMVVSAEAATLFKYRENAQDVIDEAIGRTTFSGCFLSILEVNINRY